MCVLLEASTSEASIAGEEGASGDAKLCVQLWCGDTKLCVRLEASTSEASAAREAGACARTPS